MNAIDISHTEEIYSVSRLNREVRFTLEGNFPPLWIEGEISNFSAPHSGHWYFSLKDATAQVRCCMFKPNNRRLTITPKDGMHVFIKARVSLYEGRGDFQLIAEHLEDAGVGKLQKEFEALKKKLSAAGLFDEAHKKELPLIPKRIGIITSATGAAIRDILSVLKRRFSCAPVVIYPTLVQGESAAASIVKAIQTADQRKECDVLILSRGGGSIEDLWPFNEEVVANAIYQCTIPIISGVGHEIDFTIADFVADVRAPTPSAAAELITPDLEELMSSLANDKNQLMRLIRQQMQSLQQQINWTQKHLQQQHPKRRLLEQQQHLDICEATFIRLQTKLTEHLKFRIQNLREKLFTNNPKHLIRDLEHKLKASQNVLQNSIQYNIQNQLKTLGNLAGKLDALSPLATLQRGFAIVTAENKKIIHNSKQVKAGETIDVRLSEGSLHCKVESIAN